LSLPSFSRCSASRSSPSRTRHLSSALQKRSLDHFLFLAEQRLWERGSVRTNGHLSRQPGLVDREGVTRAQDDRALDDVLKFTNVARPRVPFTRLQGSPVDLANPLGHLFRKSLHEIFDQDRNVFAAFAQGRHLDREHVQPVKEVRSE